MDTENIKNNKTPIITILIILIIALGIGLYFAISKIIEEKNGLDEDHQSITDTERGLTDQWENLRK